MKRRNSSASIVTTTRRSSSYSRLFLVAILVALATGAASGQTLDERWATIDSAFQAGDHQTVVEKVPAFVEELESREMYEQLVPPYMYLGTSRIALGLTVQGDRAFEKAKEFARLANKSELIPNVELLRAQTYLRVGTAARDGGDTFEAKRHFDYAAQYADSVPSPTLKVAALYEKANLHYAQGQLDVALETLEPALSELDDVPEGQADLARAVRAKMAELYTAAGMADKAAAVVEGGGADDQIAAAYRAADRHMRRGDFMEADRQLASVRDLVFENGSPEKIERFMTQRLALYESISRLAEGADTLKTALDELEADPAADPDALFRLRKLYTLACLESGRAEDADEALAKIAADAESGALSEELEPLYRYLRGDVAFLKNDNREAIQQYLLALDAEAALSEFEYLAALNNLALAYMRTGETELSVNYFDRLYDLADSPRTASFRVNADLNSALAFFRQSEFNRGVERLQRARDLARASDLQGLELMASLRLAEGYRLMEYESVAEQLFEEIAVRYKELENPLARAQAAAALAAFERNTGDAENALRYLREAFSITQEYGLRAASLNVAEQLADAYASADSVAKAIDLYRFTLNERLAQGALPENVAATRLKISQSFSLLGDHDSANVHVENALRELGDVRGDDFVGVDQATIDDLYLYALALTVRSQNHYFLSKRDGKLGPALDAFDEIERAVDMLNENFYSQVLTNARSKDEWFKNVNSFQLMIEVASFLYSKTSDGRYLEAAFNTSEKLRAQTFVLEVGQNIIAQLNDPELQELAALTADEAAGFGETMSLDLSSPAEEASGMRGLNIKTQKAQNQSEILAKQAEYDRIVSEMQKTKDAAANLVSINTLNLEAVQDLLESDEILLSYYSADARLYLFAVSKTERRGEIIDLGAEDLGYQVEVFRSLVQLPSSDKYRGYAEDLYDALIKPVEDMIAGKRLLIVPSGKLHNLPFAALSDGDKFFVEYNPTTILPNATMLQFIVGKELDGASARLLAIGNPTNSFTSALPGAESEVVALSQIYPGAGAFFREEAREGEIKRAMPRYDIVHFACHGLFNYEYPLLSALALAPDEQGNDGRLELHEIYNVDLTNTDLVVMSACETALAQIKKNDDMVGLVRGFLYTGVPSVVASLWKVDDNATYQLMTKFYMYLKQGDAKIDALRKAQRDMIDDPKFDHPFYWAAFALNGYPK
ncbi:MAG: CHAT domain-containing protein [Ignavibacteriales bacterium]|nr:CHAT domain-containing protein [Ignavibacteriales bacterium]